MAEQLTPELLADLLLPTSPAVHPDGSQVLVSVAPMSTRTEQKRSAVWLLSTHPDTAPRQVTTGIACDTAPRWSPDGRTIAFLSDRQKRGRSQIYIMSMEGGEASPITSESGGVAAFEWLPGERRRIAYLATDARDTEAERRRTEERDDADVYGEFWPFQRLRVMTLDEGSPTPVDVGERHVANLSVSPNGDFIAMAVWATPEIDHVMRPSTLIVVDTNTNGIVCERPLPFHSDRMAWGRDNETLYLIGLGGPTAVSGRQLWSLRFADDEPLRSLSAGAEYCVDDLVVPATGEEVLLIASVGTESAVMAYDPALGTITTLAHFPGALLSIDAAGHARTIACIGSVAERPDEVYAGVPGPGLTRISTFQDDLSAVEYGKQEVITWEREGLALDGILIFPPGTSRKDGPFATIVSLHDGPYGRWANAYLSRFGRWIAQHGYLVFMPNPRGGSGHGSAFAEAVLHTVGNDDYLDIMAGVDCLVADGLADPDRLGCGGWSQGGFMTAWIVGQTDRFKAGIMGAGISDWGMMIATSDIPTYENLMGGGNPYEGTGPHSFDAQSPISFVHRVQTPVLILHGERDERVPVSQGIFFHRGLRRYSVPTELVTYPREPHSIGERAHQIDLARRIIDWYQRWIPTGDDNGTESH